LRVRNGAVREERRWFGHRQEEIMLQKAIAVVLVGAALATAACNTVRGAARDVNSVANTVDNAT
jgi:predicted small secreted protein